MIQVLGEKYYDVRDVSRLLNLSVTTVRDYMKDGRIKGTKIGVKYYTTEKSLKDYLGQK